MKYNLGVQTVEAVYDNTGSRNPLIEALPECLDVAQFERQIKCCPPPPQACQNMSMAERRQGLALLPTVFIPLDYMYYIYDSLYRMLQSSYHTLTSRERVTRINALFSDSSGAGYGAQAQSGALLGTPGIGKTSTLKRCLMLMPQVVSHEKYLGKAFYTKQVLWLHVECPSDASQKTMAYNIVRALDMAVGSNHLDYLLRAHAGSASAVATYIKTLCVTYNVGLLVVDEIQNVVATAQRTNRIKPLIRFLTELTNDTCTAVYFTGTTLAEGVFQSEEYLRRRTRGPRLLPFKPDGAYRSFLSSLWPYQYTPEQAVLTDKLANQIYDFSGGIPAVQAVKVDRLPVGGNGFTDSPRHTVGIPVHVVHQLLEVLHRCTVVGKYGFKIITSLVETAEEQVLHVMFPTIEADVIGIFLCVGLFRAVLLFNREPFAAYFDVITH